MNEWKQTKSNLWQVDGVLNFSHHLFFLFHISRSTNSNTILFSSSPREKTSKINKKGKKGLNSHHVHRHTTSVRLPSISFLEFWQIRQWGRAMACFNELKCNYSLSRSQSLSWWWKIHFTLHLPIFPPNNLFNLKIQQQMRTHVECQFQWIHS